MSWVKNLWSRMFPEDMEENEIEAEWTEPPVVKTEKAPFRFPVIPDEEKEVFYKQEVQRPAEPIYRETPKSEVPYRRPASRPEPRTRTYESVPVNKTRRFEPTRVPSPIHGFNERKPAPIEKLLEQKEIKAEQQKTETLLVQKAPVSEKQPEAAVSETPPVVQEAIIETVQSSEEVSPVEPEKLAEPVELEEMEKPADTVVHTEEPEIKQEEIKQEEVKQEEVKQEEVQKEEVPKEEKVLERKREKTVPFNVLMLKSDKQRIKKPLEKAAIQQNTSDQKKSEAQAEVKPEPELRPEPKSETKPEMAAGSAEDLAEISAETSEPDLPAYMHPEKEFLRAPENDRKDESWMEEQGDRLIEALSHFQIQASIISIVQGPAVTQFELTVAQGVKVSKIRNLADDLKLALAAKDIRIQAPIPGKSSIGIEIPNRTSRAVRISEVIDSPQFQSSDSPLEAALGLDLTGKPVTLDLRKMPHGLIAGATGSGKSVCINSILVSLLFKSSPRDLKLLLIDPKMVELAPYNHIPHLVSPVITDVKAATASLKWAVSEMERRYQLFAHTGVRDISKYNKMVKEKGDYAQHLPYILIVIDELADLMMMSPSDVEDAICRIAQKARACGIHLVIATQRPSVDVITGLIKSNIPTRIAFSVSSQVDSRTILDSQGAERLLGRGDMLYLGNGMSAPSRIQGTFVTDEEIEDVINHVRQQGEPDYFFKEDELIKQNGSAAELDDLFEEACRFIMMQGSASTSLLQRKFHIGYNRAARLMDLIEQHGFISEQNGSKARSVLITEDDIAEVFQ